jgi:hypothetical protein
MKKIILIIAILIIANITLQAYHGYLSPVRFPQNQNLIITTKGFIDQNIPTIYSTGFQDYSPTKYIDAWSKGTEGYTDIISWTYDQKYSTYYYYTDDIANRQILKQTYENTRLVTPVDMIKLTNKTGNYKIVRIDHVRGKKSTSRSVCVPLGCRNRSVPDYYYNYNTNIKFQQVPGNYKDQLFFYVLEDINTGGTIQTNRTTFVDGETQPVITGDQVIYDSEKWAEIAQNFGGIKVEVRYGWQMLINGQYEGIVGEVEKDLSRYYKNNSTIQRFRRIAFLVATDGVRMYRIGNYYVSNEITIEMVRKLIATPISLKYEEQLSEKTYCYGNSFTINSVPPEGKSLSGGNGIYSYEWQFCPITSNPNIQTNWQVLSVPDESYLNIENLGNEKAGYYRKKVTSESQVHISNNVIVRYNGKLQQDNLIPTSQVICGENPNEIKSNYSNIYPGENHEFIWQKSTDLIGWQNVQNGNDYLYKPPKELGKVYYRRILKDNCFEDTTNIVSVEYFEAITPGEIGYDQNIISGTMPDLLESIQGASGGDGTLIYNWERKLTTENEYGSALPSSNVEEYQPTVINSAYHYRRRVTSSGGVCPSVVTNRVTIATNDDLDPGQIFMNDKMSEVQLCAGVEADSIKGTAAIGGITGAYNYKWVKSTDGIVWDTINSNTEKFKPGELVYGVHYYKRLAWRGAYGPKESNQVTFYVFSEMDGGQIKIDGTAFDTTAVICKDNVPPYIFGYDVTSGPGGHAYRWEYSTDGDNFASMQNRGVSLRIDYTLQDTVWYRRRTISNTCGDYYSNQIKINVTPPLNPEKIDIQGKICYGGTDTITGEKSSGGDGNYTYKWFVSENGKTWDEILFEEDSFLIIENQKQNLIYRRQTNNQYCGSKYSNEIITDVLDSVITPNVPIKSGYCYKSNIPLGLNNIYAEYMPKWYNENNEYVESGFSIEIEELKKDTILFVQYEDVQYGCKSKKEILQLKIDTIIADFIADVNSCEIGDAIHFTDKSTKAIEWYYGFNDGDGSRDASPWHYFNKQGFFTVDLMVKSENDCYDYVKYENLINVGRADTLPIVDTIIQQRTQYDTIIEEIIVNDTSVIDTIIEGIPTKDTTITSYSIYDTIIQQRVIYDTIINDTVGIEKINQLDFIVSIYPQPAKRYINIESEKVIDSYKIYDLNGKIILSKYLSKKDAIIYLENLNKGIYIISMEIDGKIINRKIIKQ